MFIWKREVYLDHNATTPIAPEVRRAMERVTRKFHGNVSSLHTHGRAARGIVDEARQSVAAPLSCPPERIIFTSGGTEGNNAVIMGVFRNAGGGHIVTSKIEHESVLGACRQVEKEGGAVTYLPAGGDGLVSPEAVKGAIRSETILISIMHANNETGCIQSARDIGRIAGDAGIPFHTDAVQTYGKIPTSVDELGCEFLTLTAHKINGPKGVGAIYWRGKTPWTPLISGGDQERAMRAGTEGVHQIAGLGAAARLAAMRMNEVFVRQRSLREAFVSGLREAFPDIRINEASPENQLPGTVNVIFPGKEGIRILAGLDCYEIGVSIGSACTADRVEPSHVLLGMGISAEDALSAIRFSMGAKTRERDLRYVVRVLRYILSHDPKGFSYLDPQHLDEARIRDEDTFLIDIRLQYERMLSPTIPGAREWSPIYFERFIKKIPRHKEVIIMCGTGYFSISAGYRLARLGHPCVKVVYGGYKAWEKLHPDLVETMKKYS